MSSTAPKARKEELLVTETGNELVVYDLKRFKAHRLNSTSALVWKTCDGNHSVANIGQRLTEEFGSAIDEQVVSYALKRLQSAHLLEAPLDLPGDAKRINRRELMRVLGLGAVVALPIVTSIVVPTPAQAQSVVVQINNRMQDNHLTDSNLRQASPPAVAV